MTLTIIRKFETKFYFCLLVQILVTSHVLAEKNIFLNTNDSIFIGRWLLVNIDGARGNVCPEIEFLINGKGQIIYPSKSVCRFMWNKVEKRITFYFRNKYHERVFFSDEKDFYFEVLSRDENLQLILFSIKRKHKYIFIKL